METKRAANMEGRKPPAAYSRQSKKNAEKSAGKPVSIGAIVSVLLVLIIVTVLALVYFDLIGVKDVAVRFLGLDEPTNRYMQQLADKETALAQTELNNAEKELALDKREKELDKRAVDLGEFEKELLQRQEALGQLQTLVEGLNADIGSTALMLEGMDAAKAADALNNLYSVTDIARLLLAMKSENASKVLNSMPADRAAAVIAEMLRYS
ncbi:MAG: hypothetical protein LBS18_05160 [Clostridiales bacterium]|jgi:flagellar motility protein MotE (MotC chaperone)|nr:hypothetical protein [Clostridiales bacterium]